MAHPSMILARAGRSLLALMLLLLSLPLAAQQGILWRIEGAASQASYLFGTIHSEDPRVTRLAKPVRQVFDQADSFSAEILMDLPSLTEASTLMLIHQGDTLQDMLNPKLYQQTVKLMAGHGLPEFVVRQMKPWAVAATLSLPKSRSGMFLDMLLFQDAVQAKKKVYGLETVQEQIGSMEAIPVAVQIAMLQDTVGQYAELDRLLEKLIAAYLSRDLAQLEAVTQASMAKGDKRVAEAFERELLVKRNQRMLLRMIPRLVEGNAFIAVGALHLPGKSGLLALLRQKGYRLSPVY